jgi:predicted nuclease of predicted toxin-antitoxin system
MCAVLLDTCIWGGVLSSLLSHGHDVLWSGNWERDPGDRDILEFAYAQKRILVTLDKDFGELAILKGMPHDGIIRLSGFRVSQVADVIDHLLRSYHTELIEEAIVTANPLQIRIRNA